MPTSSMQRATPKGPRSIATPKASSTSAEPAADEAARPPCLQTFAPAPATTKAAMVDTLMLRLPSPPVPQVSTSSPSTSTLSASSNMAATRPDISSAVSPFIRIAVMKEAIWEGVGAPDSTWCIEALAWSWVRSAPAVSKPRTPGQLPASSKADGGITANSVPPEVAVQNAPSYESQLHLGGSFHNGQLSGVSIPQLGRVVLHIAGGAK